MKISFIIFCLLNMMYYSVCYGKLSTSQQDKLDSLNKIITTSKYDTAIVRAYVDLSDILYVVDFDTVITLCEKSVNIIIPKLEEELSDNERLSYLKTLAGAYNNIGFTRDIK